MIYHIPLSSLLHIHHEIPRARSHHLTQNTVPSAPSCETPIRLVRVRTCASFRVMPLKSLAPMCLWPQAWTETEVQERILLRLWRGCNRPVALQLLEIGHPSPKYSLMMVPSTS